MGAAPAAPTDGEISSIEVHFFDPAKGDFGANMLKNGVFSGWNDFMREGNGG